MNRKVAIVGVVFLTACSCFGLVLFSMLAAYFDWWEDIFHWVARR